MWFQTPGTGLYRQTAGTGMLRGGQSSPLLSGLTAYWKLDEVSGNRADSHSTHTLLDYNSVGSTTGKIGNAASFVAANSMWLACETVPNIGDNDFTYWGWFRLPVTPNAAFAYLAGRRATLVGYGLDTGSTGSTFRVVLRGSEGSVEVMQALASYNDGAWHFVCVTHDRDGLMRLYVDDMTTAVASRNMSGFASIDATAPFTLGKRPGAEDTYATADIDEVGLLYRLASEAERLTCYNDGVGLTYPFA